MQVVIADKVPIKRKQRDIKKKKTKRYKTR